MEQFGVLTLGSRLKRLSDCLFTEVQDLYVRCDIAISATYFPILKLLQVSGPISVVEIASQLKLSHPAISKQVSKMVSEGLIEKVSDLKDSRRYMLMLSDKGCSVMLALKPILAEMQFVLEQVIGLAGNDFLTSLGILEEQLINGQLKSKILDRLYGVTIVPFQSIHAEGLYRINMIWLKRYFPTQIAEYDEAILSDPKSHILNKGGKIWVAVSERPDAVDILGTVMVKPNVEKGSIEMMKMAVSDHAQRKGVAQSLFNEVLRYAEARKVNVITLETSSILESARMFYEKNGFYKKHNAVPFIYERTDVYMEKCMNQNQGINSGH
ncbi:GNAT family N-acetyltransferase [Marinomonas sp. 2405UD68-3]|uniref:GNAT family N-acetyltransferase n=1 Tax=Marinomonas sp. 2405UD68-3 TaxID=3391835 RepID=UPI0039C9889E